jgi:predicted RNase H-like nuclease
VELTLIGIDCATDPARVGLARGRWQAGKVRIEAVSRGSEARPPAAQVVEWIGESASVLLAIDAPLGWPVPLAEGLAGHRAGAALDETANALFRRATDRDVRLRLGKQPLDVGADRIARTAHAALALMQAVREATGRPLDLAWTSRPASGLTAIEVYPAGTLRAHALPDRGYKRPGERARRAELVAALATRTELVIDPEPMLDDADQLDAALCLLAAADFLTGRAPGPEDPARARREGWIWVADPPSPAHTAARAESP